MAEQLEKLVGEHFGVVQSIEALKDPEADIGGIYDGIGGYLAGNEKRLRKDYKLTPEAIYGGKLSIAPAAEAQRAANIAQAMSREKIGDYALGNEKEIFGLYEGLSIMNALFALDPEQIKNEKVRGILGTSKRIEAVIKTGDNLQMREALYGYYRARGDVPALTLNYLYAATQNPESTKQQLQAIKSSLERDLRDMYTENGDFNRGKFEKDLKEEIGRLPYKTQRALYGNLAVQGVALKAEAEAARAQIEAAKKAAGKKEAEQPEELSSEEYYSEAA